MKRTLLACALGSLLCCGPAAAGTEAEQPAQVQVNALRDPELRKYEAVVAGLDAFERFHAHAPAAPELRFHVRPVRGRTTTAPAEPLRVRLEGEDTFRLPLALDANGLFTVPRSAAALDADSEVVLNQPRHNYRIEPHVRTPGLPGNVRRMGDMRLECKVKVAIAKEEMPLRWALLVNAVLFTRDWCSFFDGKHARFGFPTDTPVVAATLREGERSEVIRTGDHTIEVPVGDTSWSDDALVVLEPAEAGQPPAQDSAVPAAAGSITGTAAGTPRTAP